MIEIISSGQACGASIQGQTRKDLDSEIQQIKMRGGIPCPGLPGPELAQMIWNVSANISVYLHQPSL